MTDDNHSALAETVFQCEQRREREISDALKMEAERQAAIISNMHRLRALRLARDPELGERASPARPADISSKT
jgi:hypothetical protein